MSELPCSILEYLDTLSYDQLEFAIKKARKLQKEKDLEGFETLWVVTDGWVNLAAFKTDEPDKVREYMTNYVEGMHSSDFSDGVKATKQKIRKEEVQDYLDLNNE